MSNIGMCREITAARSPVAGPRMTDGSQRSTESAEHELETILEGIGEGFYAVDAAWRIRRFNREAERHFKLAARSVLGRVLWEIFPAARETPLGQLFLDTMARREPVQSETPSVVIEGRWLAYRLFPLQDGLGVVFRDISDRKRAESQRDLVVRELHHRLSNTFATIQAIASQSFNAPQVDPSARRAFEERLRNLARAHTALADENWNAIALHELIITSLAPYGVENPARFAINGPPVVLSAHMAVGLSMALHELSTNAVKYGSLSTESGKLAINWDVIDGRLLLTWTESDGPRVQPATRSGFGSTMLRRVLPQQINGRVDIRLEENGVICTIEAEIERPQ
jgi:PAS domain S-box-containing protein